ncbi:fimbrial protein [Burkholderia sp. Z1]|uniref:fimbrial protein n=1 Tax=Burkholderia sp. Z1 TaxID=2759039 RepID=UPI001868796B|nr:fimbrial protein [Burkholderia sp. Z1]
MHEMSEAGAMEQGEKMNKNEKPAAMRRQTKAGHGMRRLAFWLLTLAALMLGLGTRPAFAAGTISCSGTAQTVTLSMPSSVTIPRDAAVGTLLTGWFSTSNVPNYYTCTVSGVVVAGMVFEPQSLTKAGMTVAGPSGATYTVWNTNVPGVGVAIGVTTYANQCGTQPWIDLSKSTASQIPLPWAGWVCNTSGTVTSITNGGQIQAALVKTGPITAGTVTGGVLVVGASATGTGGSAPYTVAASPLVSFSLTPTIVNVAACITPNVTVNMGSTMQSAFKGIGSTTSPAIPVTVAVNACPSGLNTIQYQFIPVNAVLDSTNGVLALSSDSTASGIGLQLKDNNGNALKYNTQYTLTSYSKSTGGSYTIPLTARYYQTAASVKAGSANAVLTFTMTYQ